MLELWFCELSTSTKEEEKMEKEKIITFGARPAIDFILKRLGNNLVCAEIGVNKGYNAFHICNTIQPKILYLIDPWNDFIDVDSAEIIGEAQFLLTKALLERFTYCNFIRKTSIEAVKDFSDESLDFVYIDANHSYQSVLDDINAWYYKVKKNGVLAGHDFTTNSVCDAVLKYCNTNKIKNLFHAAQDWWFIKEE